MFTSRAEHRLLFNHGSAELRLASHAAKQGLLSRTRLQRIDAKRAAIAQWVSFLETTRTASGTWAEAIRRDRWTLALPDALIKESPAIRDEVLYLTAYQGYLEREKRQINKVAGVHHLRLDSSINYLSINGLRKESALKLTEVKPLTVGQAARISGVNPADISVLLVWLESRAARD